MTTGTGRSIRVLAVHLTKPSSSEANVLAHLLRHLDPRIEVELVVNAAGCGDPASHLHALADLPNVTVHSLDVGLPVDHANPSSRVLRLLARARHPVRRRRVLTLARDLAVDLVYTGQQRFDCRIGELAAKRLGIPQVVHLHFNVVPVLRRRTLRRLVTCDRVIAVSSFVGRQAIAAGTDPARLTVIPNTIDVASIPAAGREKTGDHHAPVVLGQIGRFVDDKGFTDTVEIYRRVLAEHPGTRLVLVGDGPLRDEVEAAVAALPVPADVQLTGWQSDPSSWLEQMHVFVHPTRQEPFGLAVLEAMAAGVPVVAYGDGGVAEIIVDGVSGFLHGYGDIDGMTASVARLVGDADLRREVGAAAQRRVKEAFDPAQAAHAFGNVLREVAGHIDDAELPSEPPLVGVVVPNYNKSAFIEATLRSALAQTYSDIELVVVDDGSTDDSVALIRLVLEGTAGRLVEVPNGGVARARNTGFQALSADAAYVIFLDSDDVLEPHAVATLVDHLERHRDAVAAYTIPTQIDADGKPLDVAPDSVRWVPHGVGRRQLDARALETPLESVYSRFQSMPSGLMIRRTAFERSGGWDPALCRPVRPFHAEDKDLTVTLALLGPIHRLDQPLYRYRILPTPHRQSMYDGLRELDRKWWNADLEPRARRRVRRAIRFDRRVAVLDAAVELADAARGHAEVPRASAARSLVTRLASWLSAPLRLSRSGQPDGSSAPPPALRR